MERVQQHPWAWSMAAVIGAVVALIAAEAGLDGRRQVAFAGPRAGAVTVAIGTHPGRRIPRSFLGLATEWDSIEAYAGPPGRRRTQLRALLQALGRAQGSPVAVRIGGDSADQSWWNPNGRPRPRTVLHDLGERQLAAAVWLARSAGGPVTLGLNLALRDPQNAVALARDLRRGLAPRRLDTVELGNEPDLYARPLRRWTLPGYVHIRVRKRADGYGPAQYEGDVQRFLPGVRRVLGRRVHVLAADFAGTSWWRALPGLLSHWRPRPDVLGGHFYAYGRCPGPAPGPGWLMAAPRAGEAQARFAPLAEIARRAHVAWRITEMNSVPCGGRAGMSDRPAAGLWMADTLFGLAAEGAAQVDVQTFNHAHYALFTLAGDDGVHLRPPMLGMVAFALAAPTGSRIVPATVRGDGVRARATIDARGQVRVLLIATRAAQATVALSGTDCPAAWLASPKGVTTPRPTRTARGCRLALPAKSLAVVG